MGPVQKPVPVGTPPSVPDPGHWIETGQGTNRRVGQVVGCQPDLLDSKRWSILVRWNRRSTTFIPWPSPEYRAFTT